ncbi:MAG: hypothetical protein HY072_00220 [Deltaproteobacteria bacterium]|nr:hypothetical protein [Deltaproteobacteria bacterium]
MGFNFNKANSYFKLSISILCLQMFFADAVHANPPYKLSVILDRVHYEAKKRKPNQLDDDVIRSFLLYASFRVDGPASTFSTCQVKFLPDPPEKDDWGNIMSPLWEGVIGDPIYRMPYGVNTAALSNNWAILPNGGTYNCSLNESPSVAGFAPELLETGGIVAGGNDRTHKNPPLIDNTWMAQLRTPDHRKTHIIIDGEELTSVNEFWIKMDEASKSIRHSSNFVAEKWSGGTFLGFPIGELMEATAHWPFE